MNEDVQDFDPQDCSALQVEILIDESWIDRFLAERQIAIPIDEKTHLTNLRINLAGGLLNVQADITEKEGSSVELSVRPWWDASNQVLNIEDLNINTKSKNILVKSAGWFTQHFLNSRLDKKIEEKANGLFKTQIEKIKAGPVNFPIPKAGNAQVSVKEITVNELIFVDHAIRVKATIDGYWKLNLMISE